jgi:hypothetical protein
MRYPTRTALITLLAATATVGMVARSHAQAPAPKAAPAPTAAARPAAGRQATGGQAANVQQVMRGILFPNSNVVFAAQSDDPDKVKKSADPSTATDPLASVYGGWEAVGNSALALREAARLLEVPRACSNGKPAPIQSPTWKQGLTELRAAGLAAYQAAQKKNQDAVLDAADKMTTACATCHDKYREKTPRCVG